MARTLEEINKEYTENCALLGDRIYRKTILDTDIQQLVQKNSALQAEATEVNKGAADGQSSAAN